MYLLLDGKNLIYRTVFANQSLGPKKHHIPIVLKLIRALINSTKPTELMVFWDAPSNEVWRKKLYPDYKNREGVVQENIIQEVGETQEILMELLPIINSYQFKKNNMEADDLIYAASRLFKDVECVIASSDADYTQIPYRMPHVKLFNPKERNYVEISKHDPVIVKCLSGDNSDNIHGYKGIGPVKGTKLAESITERVKFLKENGSKIYKDNLRLIDLSFCPFVLENELYISDDFSKQNPIFNKPEIINIIRKHKISDMITELDDLLLSFKNLRRPEQVQS